jgi:putative Mg2+ transporter-C (MgtC) family protein
MIQADWQLEASMAARVLYATFLGALVGLERHMHGITAGVRTYAAVCLGACAFGLVSLHAVSGPADPTRIASAVVAGIGFLGAGIIMRDGARTIGLTTAATVWATAAVGLAIAFEMYVLATLTAALIFLLLGLHHLPGWTRLAHDETTKDTADRHPPAPEQR